MSVKILQPGAFTTVQDAGRHGFRKAGITPGGAMDLPSYRQANDLVGNEKGEAALEMTFFGVTLTFLEDGIFALAGADMEASLNGQAIPMNRPLEGKQGDILTLGMARTGMRTYLAFAGGIDVPPVMNSRSTNIRCQLGGLNGRALAAGDILPIGNSRITYREVATRKGTPLSCSGQFSVRVLEGPQADAFTPAGLETLYHSVYTITEKSDRMGSRLEGPAIESRHGTDIISAGIVSGSIQIPHDGKPIVLLADHQTTGGYAVPAVVCSFDLPLFAQARSGSQVQFQLITQQEALEINRRLST